MSNPSESSSSPQPFAEWAVVEIMGHVKVAGFVTEATIAGGKFLRIDIPAQEKEAGYTRYYGAQSIYCISPTTEEIARGIALRLCARPVHRYELTEPDEQADNIVY